MPPNVVVILTDDQPKGLLDAMPATRALIKNQGVNLTTGISPSPLCAMSRASLLTGRYAGQDLGIWENGGAYEKTHPYEDTALPAVLHDAGYTTGLFGKYTNGWSASGSPVPVGWDEFVGISPDDGGDGAYYNYTLNGTIYPEHHGSDPADYSTDVLRDKALQFIAHAPLSQPLFLYFSPYGAHASFTPAPRHIDTWTDEVNLPPNFNASNQGKAQWLRDLPLASEARARRIIKDQHETVMAVDEAIEDIIEAMTSLGRTDTMYLFAGDNGLMRGSHRLNGKYVPYAKATELQMLARWDGHYEPGTTDDRMMTVLDLAATVAQAAGVTMPASEGVPIGQPRAGSLLEGAATDERPAYIGWRTTRYLYVRWSDGFEELYDYETDPHELTNVAADKPSKTSELRDFAQAACQPRPPGW